MNRPRRGSAESRRGRAARGSGKAPELFTLGGVRLVRQGVDETSKLGPKHLALLVYLFHEQRPMHPSEVTDLLGRGQAPEKETEGLTRAVVWLRENLPGVNVRLTAETIEVFAGVTLDTREVDTAIDGGDPQHVAELYVGEFLEGFESGSPAFDEWAQKERGRLKRAWSHAILSAARESERRRKWETAADWWRVLVARAPMRPEAVAGLLGALANSGQTEDAARAYADYRDRLKDSGVTQPADPVKQVISEHKVLRDIAEGRVKPPPEPPAAAAPMPAKPEPAVPSLDIEPTAPPQATPPPAPPPAPKKTEPPAPRPKVDTVAGFEAGAPPPTPGEAAAEAAVEPVAREDAWEEIVDIASSDDFVLPVEQKPSGAPAAARRPGGAGAGLKPPVDEAAAPEPATAPGPRRGEIDEHLKQARDAARAFVDTEYGHVRHEITSVRKAWGPTLNKWWEDLGPVRAKAAELAVAALRGLAAALVLALQMAGRGTSALVSLASGKLKTARHRAAETRVQRAHVRVERKEQRRAEKAARGDARKAEKESKQEARRKAKAAEREARRAEKEAVRAVLDTAPPQPEVAPWDEKPVDAPPPVVVQPAGAPPVGFAAPAAEMPLVEVAPPRAKRKRKPVGPLLRYFWYAPVAAGLAALAVVLGPRLIRTISGLTEDLPSRLPEVQAPSLPSVSLPRVTIRTPSFVETGVSRIAEMFSGPLLERSGEWLLLADVEIEGPDGGAATAAADGATAVTLGQMLEADLVQAGFFYVVPRERALVALRRTVGRASETLPVADALTLAEAVGYAAVLSSRVTRHEAVDSVRVQVFNAAGDTLYGVAAEVSEESSTFETLVGLGRAVRRRLGEPGDGVEASLPPSHVLTTSPSALEAYVDARWQLYSGRYSQAIAAAGLATRRDSTFALAYHLLSEAYALNGQRNQARNALESAWRFGERLSERERLRVLADRHAWDGRLGDAVLTYDDLFSAHRDDVGALKSQALLQRMIGVRGGGEGNLRVAYSIDPFDWPPLSRVARYLGYRGALPNVDSLVAAVQEAQ
ncbi:MAG: hypothetical protein JSV86_04165 [Gemmatimonadota bacterium]|nr:MAG: hypothetical protein JSV86_04165 [Gemmatimonadota bacterium]